MLGLDLGDTPLNLGDTFSVIGVEIAGYLTKMFFFYIKNSYTYIANKKTDTVCWP